MVVSETNATRRASTEQRLAIADTERFSIDSVAFGVDETIRRGPPDALSDVGTPRPVLHTAVDD